MIFEAPSGTLQHQCYRHLEKEIKIPQSVFLSGELGKITLTYSLLTKSTMPSMTAASLILGPNFKLALVCIKKGN